MATKPTEVGQVISDVARAEGGTTKGSQSAQMQSELSKQRNFDQVSSNVGSKLDTAPDSITKEDAQAVHRAETRIQGQQPPSGSISSVAQHQAAVNEGATGSTTKGTTTGSSGINGAPVDPNLQSQMDRQANFEDAASKAGGKLVNEPGNVTKEEADLLHSREQRAFGVTEKGGLASQAQHQAAENEGATSTRSNATPSNPSTQSQMDRQANYEDTAAKVGNKLGNDPENITKEEADLLHSREHRALGHTEKGGLAAQAQHQVAENTKS
ncbi:MAG: hypothetical protein L6R38_003921 [Xanthoria sp. 2 TBL-2021]|nr:MAG: hypothetical protein L6R38_003921 [Xanthoria sp. 2 TBL-2021]